MSTDRVVASWGPIVLRMDRTLVADVDQMTVPVAPLQSYSGTLVLELRGPRAQRAAFLTALSRTEEPGVVHSEGRRDVLAVPEDLQRQVLERWLVPEAPPETPLGWAVVRNRRLWRLVPVVWHRADGGTAVNGGAPVNLDPLLWTAQVPATVTMPDGHATHGVQVPEDHWADAAWSAVLRDTDRRAEGHLPPSRGPTIGFRAPREPPVWTLEPLQRLPAGTGRQIIWPGLVNGRDVRWWVTADANGVQVAYQTRGAGVWTLRIREDGLTWEAPDYDPRWASVAGRMLTRAEGWALCQLGVFWPLDPTPNPWRTTARRIGRLAQDPQEVWWGAEPCQHQGWHGVSPRFDWYVHLNDDEDDALAAVPVWELAEPDERGVADSLMWSTRSGRATLFCYASGEVEVGGTVGRVVVVPETRSIFIEDR